MRINFIIVIILFISSFEVLGQVKIEQINPDTLSLDFPVTHYQKFQNASYRITLSARNLAGNSESGEVMYDLYVTLKDSSFYIDPVNYIIGPVDNLIDYQWNNDNNTITINYGLTEKKKLLLLIQNNQIYINEQ